MSILILGKSRCPLCEKTIKNNEMAISLPAFVWNEADPLLIFNDVSMHKSCFEAHPMKAEVEKVLSELEAKTGPGKRKCRVCEKEITNPDNYILLPRLVDDENDPLFSYNYTHLHKSHAANWADLRNVICMLRALADSKWKGPELMRLIKELEEAGGIAA